jgi:hypothetical protein
MNSSRHILSQFLDLVDRKTLSRLVEGYDAESRVRHFACRQQLVCMFFAQLTWREGLRDIAKSTLANANEQRDWRIWEDLAKGLMRKVMCARFLEMRWP